MRTITRGVALALALALAPASILAVNAATGRFEMTADQRARLEDGKLAGIKAALRLSPDQEKLWAPVESEIRAGFKARAERRAEWQRKREERRAARDKEGTGAAGATPERPNLAERYERMSQRLAARAERMKAFSGAFSPFYASLGDDQKAVLGPVMHDLRLTGSRGHRGYGHWAGRARAEGWNRGSHESGNSGTGGAEHQ